jgi:nucleoside-diphosphate-sugar epimerase
MPLLPPVAQADIEHILTHSKEDWLSLSGERLFITGGTGFFGTWLLEALVAANKQLGTTIEAWVLSRSPSAFALRSPHLANATGIHWITGDVTNFTFPEGTFSHIIHAATAASAQLNATQPSEMFNSIIRGTERVLKFAQSHGTKRFLLTSSGAVYGPQPLNLAAIPETYNGSPNCLSPLSAYAEGKRVSELLCSIAARESGIEVKIARCFAFIGPHLPLDTHFAAGNFIRDALHGTPITLKGDGQTLRSYMYAADLVIALLKTLLRGQALRPYNIGSDISISILQLAQRISEMFSESMGCRVLGMNAQTPPDRYIPDISRAQNELGLPSFIELNDALQRTLNWHRKA